MAQNSKDVLFKSQVNNYISERATTTPVFTVTDSGNGNYVVSKLNGDVTLTFDGTNYIFAPSRGSAVSILATSVTSIVVDFITLSADASVLNGETVTGSGVVNLSPFSSMPDVNLLGVQTAVLSATIIGIGDLQAPTQIYTLEIGAPTIGRIINITSGEVTLDETLTIPQTTSFVVEAGATLTTTQIINVPISGEGTVNTIATPTFTVINTSNVITFNGAESGDISLSIEGDIITFTQGSIAADVTFNTTDWVAGVTRIDLATNQLLMLTPEQASIFATLATNGDTTYTAIGGEGAVNITAETFTEDTNLLFISNNLDLNFNRNINATLWIHPQHLNGSTITGDGSVVVSLHNNDTAPSTFSILTTGENVIGATGNADNITTGAGTNTIIAGAGADIITLGDAIGNDIIIIKALDSTPTLYDKIINFDITQDKLILEYEAIILDTYVHVDIASITNGIVTFDNVAAQNDEAGFTAKLSALFTELADTTNSAAFIHNGDTYVVQGDGATGMQESDIVVQLQGLDTLSDLNVMITAGTPA